MNVLETDATPGFGYVTHTRGPVKFGRPDIVLLGADPEDARASIALLNGLALRAEPGVTHPELHLNTDGLVLDISGWGLRDLG